TVARSRVGGAVALTRWHPAHSGVRGETRYRGRRVGWWHGLARRRGVRRQWCQSVLLFALDRTRIPPWRGPPGTRHGPIPPQTMVVHSRHRRRRGSAGTRNRRGTRLARPHLTGGRRIAK